MQLRQGLRATRSLSFSTSIATGVRRKPALPSTRRGQTSSTSNLFQRDIRPNHIATRCFTSSRSIDRDIATASFQTANADMTSQPKISELSDKAFSELSALTTCEISDALSALELSSEVIVLDGLRKMIPTGLDTRDGAGLDILGRAFTVKMVHASETVASPPKGHHIDNAPKGSVIFISGPHDGPNALWGDLMSTAAAAQGLKGAIVDGRIRDIRGLAQVGLPIFARGQTTFGQKTFIRPGAQQVPILFPFSAKEESTDKTYPVRSLPATIYPGDLILADTDGILVFPAAWSEERLLEIARVGKEGRATDEGITGDLQQGKGVAESMAKWRNKK